MGLMKHLTAPFLAAVVLAACGGASSGASGEAQTDKERIAALESDGKLPKLDRSSDLKGLDMNADGVRDDIEAILNAKYQGKQLAAAMQFARSYQDVLDMPDGDRIAAKALDIKNSRAFNCVTVKFVERPQQERHAVMDAIVAMTFNTKERLKAYMRFNSALSGSVLSLPDGDTCDE